LGKKRLKASDKPRDHVTLLLLLLFGLMLLAVGCFTPRQGVVIGEETWGWVFVLLPEERVLSKRVLKVSEQTGRHHIVERCDERRGRGCRVRRGGLEAIVQDSRRKAVLEPQAREPLVCFSCGLAGAIASLQQEQSQFVRCDRNGGCPHTRATAEHESEFFLVANKVAQATTCKGTFQQHAVKLFSLVDELLFTRR
jgi:hypothetical protein